MVTLLRRPAEARNDRADEAGAAASVQTLAVLLQAGAAPIVAWRHLADSGDRHAAAVVDRVDGGVSIVASIEAEGGA